MTKIKEIIRDIRDIRAVNNDYWMEILEIAATSAPDRVAIFLEGIISNDAQINRASKRLLDVLQRVQQHGILNEDQRQTDQSDAAAVLDSGA